MDPAGLSITIVTGILGKVLGDLIFGSPCPCTKSPEYVKPPMAIQRQEPVDNSEAKQKARRLLDDLKKN